MKRLASHTRRASISRLICSYVGMGLLLVLGATPAAAATLAIDKTVSTHQTKTSASISSPALTTAAPGELLLAFVASDGPASGGTQTISKVSGGGLTWRLRQRANSQAGTAEIWAADAPAILTNATVTATRGTGAYLGSITVVSFTGADQVADGPTAAASGPSGAPATTLTAARAGSMVWGVGNDWDRAAARSVGAGQTKVDEFLASVGDTMWVQRRTSPTPLGGTAVTLDDTAPTNDRWNLATVEVLPDTGEVPPDTTPPSVSLTAPGGGATLSGTVTLAATAGDASGIAGVQFLLDGNPVGSEDTSSPYGLAWDSSTVADGPHALAARARDGAGNTATSPATAVTVANGEEEPEEEGEEGETATAFELDKTVSTHQASGGTTISTPPLSTAHPGELLLAFIGSDGPNSAGAQSITGLSGGGLSWTLRRRANAQAGTAEVWQAVAPAVLSNATLTATRLSGGYQGAITVAAFSGADTSASGATAAGSAASGAPSVSLSTTRAGSWVWGVGNDWDSAKARTTGAGQELVDQFLSSSGDTFWAQRRSATTPAASTAVSIDDTAPTGDRWNLVAVEVRVAEGGEAPPDTTPPSVSLTAPGGGATLSGTANLVATASDASGIAGVQFLLDGSPLGSEDTSPPYGLAWDSTTVADGPHALAARARDGAGNTATSAEAAVAVANGGGEEAAQVGEWGPLIPLPAVAIHSALLPDGRILLFQGDFASGGQQYVLNPQTGAVTHLPDAAADLFCAGQAVLADGRVLVVGGTATSGGLGVPDITAFDWHGEAWEALAPMHYPRWYATGTTLADGKVLVTSGDNKNSGDIVPIPELYSPATDSWQSIVAASHTMPIYPFIYQLPDGRIAHLGGSEVPTASELLDLATNQWTTIDSRVIDGGSIANYEPGLFVKAGSAADDGFSGNSLKTAYTLNMNAPGATWQPTGSMKFPRSFLNLTNLPDGTVLATGGGTDKSGFVDSNAVLQAEDWNPSSGSWSTYAAMSAPRLYHSVAVLLPDGRVYVAGGGGDPGVSDQRSAQIFSPPYLFRGPRPTIASAPATAKYGATEFVATPDAASISRVSLIRTGSVTHAFDQNARATSLGFTKTAGGIDVQMPANRNDVPPGYYMLFIVNGQGVPSVASFVRFPEPEGDATPPTAPTDLTATGSAGTAALSWTAATDDTGVARYNVHRSGTEGFTPGPANRIGQTGTTSFTDSGVAAGTWYYQVTAEDGVGNVGPPSGEATANVSPAAAAAFELDKTVSTHQASGGTTISTPPLSTAHPGELLLAFIGSDGPNSAGAQSITGLSGGGLSWTLRRRANAQAGTAEVWQAVAPAVLSNATLTATRLSGGYQGAITVAAFSGADTSASGATAAGSAASGAPSVSLSTTRAGSWVWGVGNDWDSAKARTTGAGQELVDQFLSSSGDTFWAQRRSATTPAASTAVSIDDTAPTGDRWNLVAVEVRAVPTP